MVFFSILSMSLGHSKKNKYILNAEAKVLIQDKHIKHKCEVISRQRSYCLQQSLEGELLA